MLHSMEDDIHSPQHAAAWFTHWTTMDFHLVLAFFDDEHAGLVTSFESFSTFSPKPLLNIHGVVVSPGFRAKAFAAWCLTSSKRKP